MSTPHARLLQDLRAWKIPYDRVKGGRFTCTVDGFDFTWSYRTSREATGVHNAIAELIGKQPRNGVAGSKNARRNRARQIRTAATTTRHEIVTLQAAIDAAQRREHQQQIIESVITRSRVLLRAAGLRMMADDLRDFIHRWIANEGNPHRIPYEAALIRYAEHLAQLRHVG